MKEIIVIKYLNKKIHNDWENSLTPNPPFCNDEI